MQREHERNLEILTAIGEGAPVTQRALAQQLGVALGLANLCLKRLAGKGLIKIVEFPSKPAARSVCATFSPQGPGREESLAYEYLAYRCASPRTRGTLRETWLASPGRHERFGSAGGGAADLATSPCASRPRGRGVSTGGGGQFLGSGARPGHLVPSGPWDRATFDRPEQRGGSDPRACPRIAAELRRLSARRRPLSSRARSGAILVRRSRARRRRSRGAFGFTGPLHRPLLWREPRRPVLGTDRS